MPLHEYPKRRKPNEDKDQEGSTETASTKEDMETKEASEEPQIKKGVDESPGKTSKKHENSVEPISSPEEKPNTEEKETKKGDSKVNDQPKEDNGSVVDNQKETETPPNPVEETPKEAKSEVSEKKSAEKTKPEIEAVSDNENQTESESEPKPSIVKDKLPRECASSNEKSDKVAKETTAKAEPDLKECTKPRKSESETKDSVSDKETKEKEITKIKTDGDKAKNLLQSDDTKKISDEPMEIKETSEQPQSELLVKINIADHQLEIKEKVNNDEAPPPANQIKTSEAKEKDVAPDKKSENLVKDDAVKKEQGTSSVPSSVKTRKEKVNVEESAIIKNSQPEESSKETTKTSTVEIRKAENGTENAVEKPTVTKETANIIDCKPESVIENSIVVNQLEPSKCSKEAKADLAKDTNISNVTEIKETVAKVDSPCESPTKASTVDRKVGLEDREASNVSNQIENVVETVVDRETHVKEVVVKSDSPSDSVEANTTKTTPEVRKSASNIEEKSSIVKVNSEDDKDGPKENSSRVEKPSEIVMETNTLEVKDPTPNKDCRSEILTEDTEKQAELKESAKIIDNQTEIQSNMDNSTDTMPNTNILNNCLEINSRDDAEGSSNKPKDEVEETDVKNAEAENLVDTSKTQKRVSSSENISENDYEAKEVENNFVKADYEPPTKKRTLCVNVTESETGINANNVENETAPSKEDEQAEVEIANITSQSDTSAENPMNSQIKSPLPPTSTNILGKKVIRPSCWSEKQLKYFKSENYWLRVKNGKLGCDVCIQVGRLNVKKRMGVSVSPEWTNFSITHYGATLLQQQRSLRKKVFEHRKSMAHKMSEHILEHCKLSCKIKNFATNSEEYQRNTPTPAPRIMEVEQTPPNQDGAEPQPNEPVALTGDMLVPQIKLEETSPDEDRSSPRSGWLTSWESRVNSELRGQLNIREISSQTNNDDIIRINEQPEGSTPRQERTSEINSSSEQQVSVRILEQENVHDGTNQDRNQESAPSDEDQRPSISIIRTPSNLISPNIAQQQNLQENSRQESCEDVSRSTEQRKQSQTSQTSAVILEQQSRSRQGAQDAPEDILQQWDLADFPLSYPLLITQRDQDLFKVFRTVYKIIKLNNSFVDLSLDIELQNLNGCHIDKNLQRICASDVCRHISLQMKHKLVKYILSSESSRFSILLEESNVLNTEPILLIYIRSSISGHAKPVDIFLDMIELETDSEKIFASVVSCLETHNISENILKRRLISVCIDGASANLGVSSDVPAVFHERFPNIIIWHCSVQSLEPTVSNIVENVSKVNDFISFIEKLYCVHRMSPKNKKELADCAKILEQQLSQIGNATSLKLVSSCFETVKAIWHSFSSLHEYFSNSATDASRSLYERSVFAELKSRLSSVQFVRNLGIMYDALQEMNELSAELRQHQFSLVEAHRSLCRQIKIFECMIVQPGPMTKKALEAANNATFDAVRLGVLKGSCAEIEREQFFTALANDLKCRLLSAKFPGSTSQNNNYDSLISEMNVLYKKFWPDDLSITYGEEELASICERFGVETRPVIRAFREFKETAGRILNESLEKLVQIINTVPVAMTEYKRVFEKINSLLKVQSPVSMKAISDIVFIQLYGPPLHKFTPLWYVKSWTEEEMHSLDDAEEPMEDSSSAPKENPLWKLF